MDINNKNFKSSNIIIFILCFIVAAGLVNPKNIKIDENYIYLLKDIYRTSKDIKILANEVDEIKKDIIKQQYILDQKDENIFMQQTSALQIKADINDLEFYNGFTDVRGPGVMVKVADNLTDDELDIMSKIVHDADVTVIINDLRNAGAEAIDVNGKRITNTSEVVCAGPTLRINNEAVPMPFIIRAIGDQEKLYEAVTKEDSYAYHIKEVFGINIIVMKSYDLVIPRHYGGSGEIKYANIKE